MQPAQQASKEQGKGKDERVKRKKIGRGRIVVPSPFRTHFDFPPYLRPVTQANLNGDANSRIYGKALVMFQFSKKFAKRGSLQSGRVTPVNEGDPLAKYRQKKLPIRLTQKMKFNYFYIPRVRVFQNIDYISKSTKIKLSYT